MTQLAETHSKLTRVGGGGGVGVGDGARGGASNPTVDPKSPYYPSLPNAYLRLTRLQHLETSQIEDALLVSAALRRMKARAPEIRRLAASLFGGL